MAAISITRPSRFFGAGAINKRLPSRFFGVGIIEKRSPSRYFGVGIIEKRSPSRYQSSHYCLRVSRFQEVVPIATITRPSSYFGAGAIDRRLPSRFFPSSLMIVKMLSRMNLSNEVSLHFTSRFQQLSTFEAKSFPTRFCASRLTPQIGVDSIGNLQFTVTPENPAATQSP